MRGFLEWWDDVGKLALLTVGIFAFVFAGW